MPKKETPKYDKLLQYALRLIAAKRYTIFELRKKLVKRTSGKLSFTALSGNLSPHVPDVHCGLRFPCRLVPDSFSEVPKYNAVDDVGGGTTGKMIDKVIARLEELKYLDDKKFVENYIADRVEFKPRGKFLIKRELKLKGIAEKAIEECLKNLPIDEVEIALSTLRKRERLWQAYPLQKKKEKAFRYLASKGFEPDAIYKAVKRCYDRNME